MITFDPGFNCTANCASTITYIDGEKGKLLYRGYSIEDLTAKASLMETYYLLFYGSLPSGSELVRFEETVVG
jgi:citrate synthase